MQRVLRFLAAAGLLAIATGAAAGGSISVSADEGNNNEGDAAGHVYVNDNTAGINTVAAFDQNADASLTPIEGSPFAAGGSGTGTVVGSQGALQVTRDGLYLLAVDAGSNQISVLHIRRDGSLRQVEGSPVSSGGIEPVSIAVHGSLVYVANEGDKTAGNGSNYTGFRLRGGHLTPIRSSTVVLPSTANPGDVLFNSTGTSLIGVEVGTTNPSTFLIDSFVVAEDGRLAPAPGSPFAAQVAGPFGSEFSPQNPAHLYVSNAHGGAGNGSVSAFTVAGNGALSSIGGSPYPDAQTAPCWVEISHDGKYLFTVNTGSTTISSYSILANGSLAYSSTTGFKSGLGIRPFDARLSPNGENLYVVDAALNAVSAFAVNGGTLTELASSPVALPPGATPFGIVVT